MNKIKITSILIILLLSGCLKRNDIVPTKNYVFNNLIVGSVQVNSFEGSEDNKCFFSVSQAGSNNKSYSGWEVYSNSTCSIIDFAYSDGFLYTPGSDKAGEIFRFTADWRNLERWYIRNTGGLILTNIKKDQFDTIRTIDRSLNNQIIENILLYKNGVYFFENNRAYGLLYIKEGDSYGISVVYKATMKR
jgi:hypothetical protein